MLQRILPEELKLGMYIDSAVAARGSEEEEGVNFLNNVQVDNKEKLEKFRNLKLRYIVIDTDRFIKISEPEKEPAKTTELKKPQPVKKPEEKKTEEKKPVEEPEKKTAGEPAPAFIKEIHKDDEPKSHIQWKPITGTEETTFDEEVRQAKLIKNHAHSLVKGYMEDVRMGRPLDPEAAGVQAKEIVDSLFRNEDALVSLTRLKSFDEYTFTHSVNVAVLVSAFAKKLGFNRARLERLAVGGICHDLGKAKIPIEVLNKPGRYTQEEREIMKAHPVHSHRILEETEGVHADSKRVALEHHERLDGKGYPDGKSLHELHIDTNIASICDVYDAMTSARVYKPAMPLPQAIEFLLERAGTEFKRNLLQTFVEHIGAYPVGSLVELFTGELAVVKEIHHDDITRPHVVVISDKYKKMLEKPPVVFLANFDDKNRSISKYLDPLQFNLNPNDFLEKNAEPPQ